MLHTLETPGGKTVDWFGPSTVEIVKVLTKAGHTKSTRPKGKGSNAVPTVGFAATKPRDVAYVEVWSTMRGFGTESYRRTLTSAGYVIVDHPTRAGHLVVFCTPRERDHDGKLLRTRASSTK